MFLQVEEKSLKHQNDSLSGFFHSTLKRTLAPGGSSVAEHFSGQGFKPRLFRFHWDRKNVKIL
jgi:hypothetical protein